MVDQNPVEMVGSLVWVGQNVVVGVLVDHHKSGMDLVAAYLEVEVEGVGFSTVQTKKELHI